jgi:RNA recognition motif-containing protein
LKLYVGNLNYQTTDEDLRQAFAPYGEIASAQVIMDETGRSRGFGFVEIEDKAAAEKAIQELGGSQLQGRALTVNEARPRNDRGGGGSRSGSRGGGGGYRSGGDRW